MLKNMARNAVDTLDRAGMRKALAAGAGLAARIAGRTQSFSVDADGDWVNRQPGATLISPDPLFSHFPAKQAEIRDLWCEQFVPVEGSVIVDVGAGIGDEAAVFSQMVGESGHIYAIEAHPHTFRCLQKTIERSGLTNVTAVQCAIADEAGVLFIEDTDAQNHISHSVVKSAGKGVEVPAMSLDAFIAEHDIGHVDLLKMNIEGAERLAIRGMAQAKAIVRHYAISCHDFVADRGPGAEDLRTRKEILAYFEAMQFDIERRADDPRPWVRDYVYARKA